ncbi:MAG: neprosin family prolyl endopeptidase [Bryobacteraceae bacterium]
MSRERSHFLRASLLAAIPLMTVFAQTSNAQTATATFSPFDKFIENVKSVDANEVLSRHGARVKAAAAVEEMRQHILNMYEGVQIRHSYVLGGQIFDCVPIEQQPSVRILGLKTIAEPPAALAEPSHDEDRSIRRASAQLPEGKTEDDFGNSLGCEANTIPMARITLEQLSRFETLQKFFEKGPNGTGHAPDAAATGNPAAVNTSHAYSIAEQYVNNIGANTYINYWRPYVDAVENEVFSLAQLWVVGTSTNPVQTAEAGWQNCFVVYGNTNSNLFVYWTADNYSKTGCYNLTCPAFVQTNNSYHLGSPLGYSSIFNGPQYDVQMYYLLSNGNWWFGINGAWVGYYPSSIYRGGQLSKYSNLLQFGSESAPGYYESVNVWAGEGSTQFSTMGTGYAAYQRLIFYNTSSNSAYWANLTAYQPSPKCYSITGPFYNSSWGEYFYFGGPGGSSCL